MRAGEKKQDAKGAGKGGKPDAKKKPKGVSSSSSAGWLLGTHVVLKNAFPLPCLRAQK